MSVKLPVLKSGTVKLLKGKTLPDDAEKHHGAFNRNTSSRLERTNNIKSRIKQPQNYSRDEDDQNASDTSTNLNKSRTVAVNNHPKAIINSS